MRQITFEIDSNQKLYISIYEKIKDSILNGEMLPNEKLPSKRILAENLGVSINTIMSAYFILLDEGYIYSIEKKGFFVTDYQFIHNNQKKTMTIQDNQDIVEPKIDFTTKNINIENFPLNNWRKVAKEILLTDDAFSHKSPFEGDANLRKQIATHLFENRGMSVSPNQIVIGSGIEYLISLLVPILNAQSIMFENPGYLRIVNLFRLLGLTIQSGDVDDEGINISCIKNNLPDLIYLTPSSQFPTGIKMSLQRKKEILEYAVENNSIILEDDYDSEFRIFGKPSRSLYSMSSKNVIFVSAFSRTLSPALRISYMILPEDILSSFEKRYAAFSTTVPTFEQKVLSRFIELGYYQRHLNRVKSIYRKNREAIIKILEKHTDTFEINYKDSYLSLLVKINEKIDLSKIKLELKAAKIDINFLSDFVIDHSLDFIDYLIIGYSNIKENEIDLSINKLIGIMK